MKLAEMFTLLNLYVDDVVSSTAATTLINAGQNKMAAEIKAAFPQLSVTDTEGTFVFPEKYHETPVLYAAAMIKAQDSSIREKESFLGQFEQGKADFIENWTVPPRYKDDQNVQQFRSTADVSLVIPTTYTITSETYDPNFSQLIVYVNDLKTTRYTFPTSEVYPTVTTSTYSNNIKSFTLLDVPPADAYITAIWEIHAEYQSPPYSWWTF